MKKKRKLKWIEVINMQAFIQCDTDPEIYRISNGSRDQMRHLLLKWSMQIVNYCKHNKLHAHFMFSQGKTYLATRIRFAMGKQKYYVTLFAKNDNFRPNKKLVTIKLNEIMQNVDQALNYLEYKKGPKADVSIFASSDELYQKLHF